MRTGVLVAAALALACAVGCDSGSGPAGGAAGIDAQAVMRAKCTACHQLDKVEAQHLQREKWAATIDEMIDKGAQLSAEERSALIEFLTQRDRDLPKTEH